MVPNAQGGQAELLLVEDNPADVRLTQEAFSAATVPHRLHVAKDGVEAMAFLRREDGYADAPQPDLVLLDLNLPRKSGHEVLAEMKADQRLAEIPVVILSSSEANDDVRKSYQLQASSYVCKPVDLEKFFEIVRDIESYWLDTVRLPPRAEV